MIMDKETLFVALSNQKGGVGKSAFTILLASYFHYVENLNVAVIDCDSPQHSLVRMRDRDKKAIDRSDHYKQQMMAQWERIQKKAYPIVGVRAEKAREAADELVRNSENHIDLVLVDLPGTVDAQGVFRTIVNMDYVITPITADKMVMQSSLSFSTTVLDYIRDRPEIPLKDILFFWNKIERRANTEVFDIYRMMMQRLKLTVLETTVPDTCRYDKELSVSSKSYFRCTLLPPPAKLLKGSGFVELANELKEKLKL